MKESDITYQVKPKAVIITLNLLDHLNALTGSQYLRLGNFMERADHEANTIFTIIQSTGRYFSAGANPSNFSNENGEEGSLDQYKLWLENFVAQNVFLTDVFHSHSKVLVAALNGPAIGLSSALVALCDLVYVMDTSKVFLLMPFANLGLVAEGAALATIFMRLGCTRCSEALLLSKPIRGPELVKSGFVTKSYDGMFTSTKQFNDTVYHDVFDHVSGLHEPSILINKEIIKANRDDIINAASSKEAIIGFNMWIQNVPQGRFEKIIRREIKHKL